jgi:hypothetical protein
MIRELTREQYDTRHGGPFDRGSADSYYHRARDPHYYPEGSYNSDRITEDQMTPAMLEAYHAGYDYNEQCGDKKDWS